MSIMTDWFYGFVKKGGKMVEKDVKIGRVLRFNIPPLRDHCMSSCNFQNCEPSPFTAFVLIPMPVHQTSSYLLYLNWFPFLVSSWGFCTSN